MALAASLTPANAQEDVSPESQTLGLPDRFPELFVCSGRSLSDERNAALFTNGRFGALRCGIVTGFGRLQWADHVEKGDLVSQSFTVLSPLLM